jgi:hypothetical protein
VPIFESVIQAVWANVAPRTALAPPSPEAKRQLACKSVNPESDEIVKGSRKAITECFRVDAKGKVVDTEYRLVSQEGRQVKPDREDRTAQRKVSTPQNAPFSNAWSQDPWRVQQQWGGWQWGPGQHGREERRTQQPTWGSWR